MITFPKPSFWMANNYRAPVKRPFLCLFTCLAIRAINRDS